MSAPPATASCPANLCDRTESLKLASAKSSPVLKALRTVDSPQASRLENLIRGSWAPNAIYALCRLGIPDMLPQHQHQHAPGLTAQQLAAQAGCSAPSLQRLLRLCAAYGLLEETPGEDPGAPGGDRGTRFHLTPDGAMLQDSHPSCMKWLAMMLGLPGHYMSRGCLYDNVKTGRMGFEAAFGKDWYSYVAEQPIEAEAFDKAMTATSSACARPVAAAYDFGRHPVIVDIGGGQGLLMTAILQRHPGVSQGYVMDLPQVVAKARRLGQRGQERLEYVEGDFFKAFPLEADCFVMRLVLHDWLDEDAARILRRARAALRSPAGRLVVVEAILPELVGADASEADVEQLEFDMGMMTMTHGRERMRSEWEALYRSAGLFMERVLPAGRVPLMVVAPLTGQLQQQEVDTNGDANGGDASDGPH